MDPRPSEHAATRRPSDPGPAPAAPAVGMLAGRAEQVVKGEDSWGSAIAAEEDRAQTVQHDKRDPRKTQRKDNRPKDDHCKDDRPKEVDRRSSRKGLKERRDIMLQERKAPTFAQSLRTSSAKRLVPDKENREARAQERLHQLDVRAKSWRDEGSAVAPHPVDPPVWDLPPTKRVLRPEAPQCTSPVPMAQSPVPTHASLPSHGTQISLPSTVRGKPPPREPAVCQAVSPTRSDDPHPFRRVLAPREVWEVPIDHELDCRIDRAGRASLRSSATSWGPPRDAPAHRAHLLPQYTPAHIPGQLLHVFSLPANEF